MWPFKRNNSSGLEPAEVNEYYQSQNSSRRGIALLVGGAGLIVSLMIALGLFFGGRWAYHHTLGKPKTESQKPETTVNTGSQESSATSSEPSSNSAAPTQSSTSSTQPSGGETSSRLVNTGPDADL